MTVQTQEQVRKINGLQYTLSQLAEITGLSEQTLRATPNAAIEGIVQANEKARQAEQKAKSTSRPPKKTPYEKFMEKCDGQMGEGIYKMISEYFAGYSANKDNMSTTEVYMARRYGPVVMAVLYEQGLLSQEMATAIAEYYS